MLGYDKFNVSQTVFLKPELINETTSHSYEGTVKKDAYPDVLISLECKIISRTDPHRVSSINNVIPLLETPDPHVGCTSRPNALRIPSLRIPCVILRLRTVHG